MQRRRLILTIQFNSGFLDENNKIFFAMSAEISNAGRTLAGAKKKHVKVKDLTKTAGPNAVNMAAFVERPDNKSIDEQPLRDNAVVDEQFPTDALGQETEEDVLMTEKLQLQKEFQEAGKPGVTPFGVLQAKDSDFQWLQKKREQEIEANFQAWFAQGYDRATPEQKKIARELYPEFYAQRMRYLDKQIELQRDIARIKLEGPKTKEDMILLFSIEAGFIDGEPLKHILDPEAAEKAKAKEEQQLRFRRGLLNPRRLPRGDWGTKTREINAQSLTGKKSAGLYGGTPAYRLGTTVGQTSYGFSAFGDIDEKQEMAVQWSRLKNALDL